MYHKKKLLVLLGAGSSVEQEFPSTGALSTEVRGWASDYAKKRPLGRGDENERLQRIDFFGRLWKNRTDYLAGWSDEHHEMFIARTAPNYERVLGDLHVLMNGVLPKPYGDPILRQVARAEVFRGLKIAPDRKGAEEHVSNKTYYAVDGQLHHLHEKLAKRIRDHSNVFQIELENGRGEAAFKPYQELLAGLADAFSVGVYNLNYDSVALHALPKFFVGFDRRRGPFLPAEVLARQEWEFLYHLHGSVHHRIRDGSRIMEDHDYGVSVVWHNDLSQTGDTEDWRDVGFVEPRSDEKRMLLTSLVAGGWKLDQLQGEPYLTFYSTLLRHAHQADAILVGGYGFGDSHVNSVLKQVLRAKQSPHNRPPILVLDFDKEARPVAKRHDGWRRGMSNALHLSPALFRCPSEKGRAQWLELPDTVPAGEFETSPQVPVAIWNQGFNASAKHLEHIVRWLDGERAAL